MRGKRVVVTRAPHQAGDLADRLRDRGAEPLLYPCIDIQAPHDTTELDDALRLAAAGAFDWLILTSSNTVETLRQRVTALDLSLARVPVAAVGPSTARAAESALGVRVSALPDEHVAEALAEILKPMPGMRLLLPQADIARNTLRDLLAEAGTEVTVVTSYYTVMGRGGVDLPELLAARQVDAITFTSSSTVTNCLSRLQDEGGDEAKLADIVMACIGPSTAKTAAEAGLTRLVVPAVYTLDSMIESLVTLFETVEE